MYIIHFAHKVNDERRFIDPIFMENLEPNDFVQMRTWFTNINRTLFGYAKEKSDNTLLTMMEPENIHLDQWKSITHPDDVSTLIYCIRRVPDTATFPRGARIDQE